MNEWIEIILIGISLAMDALAVSVALAAAERKEFGWGKILLTAGAFGLFQALMPLAGWFGGCLAGAIFQAFGKYIAAALLAFIGGKMIVDSRNGENVLFSYRMLIVLAFATSIDALLVGVSFACLQQPYVGLSVLLIGIITTLISAAGCFAGRIFGSIFDGKCEIAGGVVLIGIGIKVLLFN